MLRNNFNFSNRYYIFLVNHCNRKRCWSNQNATRSWQERSKALAYPTEKKEAKEEEDLRMFEFLKPKVKMRPEELGLALATVLVTVWLEKITKHSKEYGKMVSGITQSELSNLWQLFLILHCTEISVEVETSNAENKRIILDSFWSSVRDLLNESGLENEATVFQSKITQWYEALRRLAIDIDSTFPSPGSLGPGKALFLMAFQNRDIRENIDLITHLTGYFVATEAALRKFVSGSIKKTKLLPTMISYE